jgi:hypothetical protein
MRMMLRDGQYQLLCLPCADAYEMKAATPFPGSQSFETDQVV